MESYGRSLQPLGATLFPLGGGGLCLGLRGLIVNVWAMRMVKNVYTFPQ